MARQGKGPDGEFIAKFNNDHKWITVYEQNRRLQPLSHSLHADTKEQYRDHRVGQQWLYWLEHCDQASAQQHDGRIIKQDQQLMKWLEHCVRVSVQQYGGRDSVLSG